MDTVRDLYESLPYPERDPRDEARRLVKGSPGRLEEIDHYIYSGRRDWSRPMRVLVAGGGTGDGLIMIAESLRARGTPAQIVYLDLSSASRRIAEERAAARGLTSIRFETGSLLGAARFGPFDYIDCCGVLHHLADPPEGLAALTASLEADGGMGLMVYAPYGRSGVYEMQEVLRLLAPATMEMAQRVAIARKLVKALPASNRLARNPFVNDHKSTDAAIADLLLHPQDRSYTVLEFAGLIEGAGLRIASLFEPMLYQAEFFMTDRSFAQSLKSLAPLERAAVAEAMHAMLSKHIAYVVKAENPALPAEPASDMIPVLTDVAGPRLAEAIDGQGRFRGELRGLKIALELSPLAGDVLRAVDGQRTLGDITARLLVQAGRAAAEAAVAETVRALNGAGVLHLRAG